ncbi:hypothetical protein NKR23_g8348 [Pleurostoma richardsiae]|uniref:Uncharacterized protein n=1 Tax=Pleurostoma richardsiae TaxID=41990 RepID=A0AA38VPL1_9PEZI|nr:hypothetical protein NKR23_g8348 [Pleurostoma richardsiae]
MWKSCSRDLRAQIDNLAASLAAARFAVVKSPQQVRDVLHLWSSLSAIDTYSAELEQLWRRDDRTNTPSAAFTQNVLVLAQDISDLVDYAKKLHACSRCRGDGSVSAGRTGCKWCQFCVIYTSLKLQHLAAKFRIQLRYQFGQHQAESIFTSWPTLESDARNEASLLLEARNIEKTLSILEPVTSEEQQSSVGESSVKTGDDGSSVMAESGSHYTEDGSSCSQCGCQPDTATKLKDSQLAYKAVVSDLREVKAKLASLLVAGEKFDEAAKLCRDIRDMELRAMQDTKEDEVKYNEAETKYLHFGDELVKVLIKLSQYEEAKDVATATLRRRRELDPSNSAHQGEQRPLRLETKRSHRQYCQLLRLRKEWWDIALEEHRSVWKQYDMLDTDPLWATENGYQYSQLLSRKGEWEPAAYNHWAVYQKRKDAPEIGLRSERTVESAEKLVYCEEKKGKAANDERIDAVITEVWEARNKEPSLKLLNLGQKLGLRRQKQGDDADAATILRKVWNAMCARESRLRKADTATMTTAKALVHSYEKRQDWAKAVEIRKWIYDTEEKAVPKDERRVIEALQALGLARSQSGDLKVACTNLKDAWKKAQRVFGENDRFTLESGLEYAKVVEALGNRKQADLLFDQFWKLVENRAGGTAKVMSVILEAGGRVANQHWGRLERGCVTGTEYLGQWQEAADVLKQLLQFGEGLLSPAASLSYTYRYGVCLFKIAMLKGLPEGNQMFKQAEEQLRRAWEGLGNDSEESADAAYYFGRSLLKQAPPKPRLAVDILAIAIKLWERKSGSAIKDTHNYSKALKIAEDMLLGRTRYIE